MKPTEKHPELAKFLDDMRLNVNRCRDYYRLRTGGSYDDEVVVRVSKKGRDIMKPVPTVKQQKEKLFPVHRKELIANIDELVLYFKRDLDYYGKVYMACNMDILDDWLKEREQK